MKGKAKLISGLIKLMQYISNRSLYHYYYYYYFADENKDSLVSSMIFWNLFVYLR